MQGLKWIGSKKGFLGYPGVPGRDLSAEEVAEHGEEFLLGTGLYEKPAGKRKVKQEPVEHKEQE